MENNSTFGFLPLAESEYKLYIKLTEKTDNPPYHRAHSIILFNERKNIAATLYICEDEASRKFYSCDVIEILNEICPSIYTDKVNIKNHIQIAYSIDNLQQVSLCVEALLNSYKKEFSLQEWEEAANNYKPE